MAKKDLTKTGGSDPSWSPTVETPEALKRRTQNRLYPPHMATNIKPIARRVEREPALPSAREVSEKTRRTLHPSLGKAVPPGNAPVETV